MKIKDLANNLVLNFFQGLSFVLIGTAYVWIHNSDNILMWIPYTIQVSLGIVFVRKLCFEEFKGNDLK